MAFPTNCRSTQCEADGVSPQGNRCDLQAIVLFGKSSKLEMPQHSCVGIPGEAISAPPSPDPWARAQGNGTGV